MIDSLCRTITRDFWYHLTPKMMEDLNEIWMQNQTED
jgi:hypothetical protein